ncbi:endonuclease III domain-containing protein [Thermospira aquatica]|uniref:DNA repair protein n=1 Tax=Thermospira aquatica TaxID=2828656 RepID=A0AAX3BEZ6_9SPIR|nr:hypothetical protein [Thermospira aquatica]URA10781.1 DNA repair protein [Thermospira aquatica]
MISLRELYDLLFEAFGPQNWWPIVENGTSRYLPEYVRRERTKEEILEIWIGAILTQNTAWKNVEKALIALKSEIAMSPEALFSCPEEKLASLIRSAGYYTQKAKKIHISMEYILTALSGDPSQLKSMSLAEARKALLSLWGIGPETADSILLYGLRFPVFVIDAYTRRILKKLGYTQAQASYDELQKLFHRSLPPDPYLYGEYHALLVVTGKLCGKKPQCLDCPLASFCEEAHKSFK